MSSTINSGESTKYRANVGGILYFERHLLLCERSDYPGEWQFPQGGVKSGENAELAFYREMHEELGVEKEVFTSIQVSKKIYKYDYPETAVKARSRYKGQEQTFVLGTLSKLPVLKLNYEFKSYIWVLPQYVENFKYSFFKKAAAFEAMRDFQLLT